MACPAEALGAKGVREELLDTARRNMEPLVTRGLARRGPAAWLPDDGDPGTDGGRARREGGKGEGARRVVDGDEREIEVGVLAAYTGEPRQTPRVLGEPPEVGPERRVAAVPVAEPPGGVHTVKRPSAPPRRI